MFQSALPFETTRTDVEINKRNEKLIKAVVDELAWKPYLVHLSTCLMSICMLNNALKNTLSFLNKQTNIFLSILRPANFFSSHHILCFIYFSLQTPFKAHIFQSIVWYIFMLVMSTDFTLFIIEHRGWEPGLFGTCCPKYLDRPQALAASLSAQVDFRFEWNQRQRRDVRPILSANRSNCG